MMIQQQHTLRLNHNKRRQPSSKQLHHVMISFYICFSIPFLAVIALFVLYFMIMMEYQYNQRQYQPNNAAAPVMKKALLKTSSQRKQRHEQGDMNHHDHVKYHIVFSTGCSLYQDWQSYLFFYQMMMMGQVGTITRIVSGCTNDEQRTLQHIFDTQIKTMDTNSSDTIFAIHFTPDYSHIHGSKSSYVYFNKPYGLKHWMEHQLGYPDHVTARNNNSIVILMDPDQLLMRPFFNNDFSHTEWKFIPVNITPRYNISHGYPMGQLYGFGLQWKYKVNITQIFQTLRKDSITSPVTNMSNTEAQRGYIVGPPYIATAYDMYQIASLWSALVVPTYQQYPHLLAEMYAYCLAAAHLSLSHQTAINFMISDISIGSKSEGWRGIDHNISTQGICSHPYESQHLPYVLHYCQRYGIGSYFFGKRRLPKNILSCDGGMLQEPPSSVYDLYDVAYFPDNHHQPRNFGNEQDKKRNTFMVCYLIPSLNNALSYYKRKHCDGTSTSLIANYTKGISLGDGPISSHV